jgi:hypothetical protein
MAIYVSNPLQSTGRMSNRDDIRAIIMCRRNSHIIANKNFLTQHQRADLENESSCPLYSEIWWRQSVPVAALVAKEIPAQSGA